VSTKAGEGQSLALPEGWTAKALTICLPIRNPLA
jgi:hypothetical protein